MVKTDNKRRLEVNSFHEDDVNALVAPTRLPPLNNSHELVDHGAGKKQKNQGDILKQVLVLHMESCVHSAQRRATLPGPCDLANLPLFQQARSADIVYLKKSHARRKELQMGGGAPAPGGRAPGGRAEAGTAERAGGAA